MARNNVIYDLCLWFFNIILDIFFREIKARGAHRIPAEGPIIFVVAPHANQFVDPITVMRECRRRVSFLIAEKSMHQRGIGFFARLIGAIPVVRPQDLAKPGAGTIQLLNLKTDPLRITGIDTKFLSQLHPQDTIALPKGIGAADVTQIISDTELLIKKEFKDIKAIDMLTGDEGCPYKCLPRIEQDSVYKAVHETLNQGNCIAIFPEGGSHDRAEMLPLKAGVTIMALGAMAAHPGLDVKIVPCGLNYFHPHKFRSRAVIEFGIPITVPSEYVGKFKAGGVEKREVCGKLLDSIHNALKSVTVGASNYETLMLLQAARRLYKPAHRKLQISQVVELNRRFAIGYEKFKNEPKVHELQQKVLAYNQLLKYHGLRDHQVNRTALGGPRALGLLLYRIAVLTVWGLLSFPGGILNLPTVIVARAISAKKAREALKASSVKIAGRDVLATWKLLVGLAFIPTLYAFYTLIVFVVVLRTDWSLNWKLLTPILTWNLLPFVSYASLRFGENGMDVYRSLRPLFLSISGAASLGNLRSVRDRLSHDITELINEYGPQVFPDFDSERMFAPTNNSSSRPSSRPTTPTSAAAAAMRLAGGFFTTKVDWLDDKIFNWSQAGNSETDDIFFFIDKQGSVSGRASSRGGSASEAEEERGARFGTGTSRSRSRSRTSNFGTGLSSDGKIGAMTELPRDRALTEVIKGKDGASGRREVGKEDDGYAGDKEDYGESKKNI